MKTKSLNLKLKFKSMKHKRNTKSQSGFGFMTHRNRQMTNSGIGGSDANLQQNMGNESPTSINNYGKKLKGKK